MRPSIVSLFLLSILVLSSSASLGGRAGDDEAVPGGWATADAGAAGSRGSETVIRSDREWASRLTPGQFYVTRRKGTEPAFSGRYVNHHAPGVYACVCCGAGLFDSTAKFHSGTGWPSFFRPIAGDRLETGTDLRTAEVRVEVLCRRCGAHLGHVFADGPPPTGLRFCINSVALRFVPRGAGEAKPAPKSGASTADRPDG